jgi:hypothetical protein
MKTLAHHVSHFQNVALVAIADEVLQESEKTFLVSLGERLGIDHQEMVNCHTLINPISHQHGRKKPTISLPIP